MLLFARTLIGLAIGADSAIATAYIAEYTSRNRRGALSMLQQWMITVGIVAAFRVALLILWLLPSCSARCSRPAAPRSPPPWPVSRSPRSSPRST